MCYYYKFKIKFFHVDKQLNQIFLQQISSLNNIKKNKLWSFYKTHKKIHK